VAVAVTVRRTGINEQYEGASSGNTSRKKGAGCRERVTATKTPSRLAK